MTQIRADIENKVGRSEPIKLIATLFAAAAAAVAAVFCARGYVLGRGQ